MAARLLALYHQPADPAAFDAYFTTTHAALAKKMPGLRSFTSSQGAITTPEGRVPPYHLIAELTWDSLADLQAAFVSAEGKAAAADLPNFATGGVSLLVFELGEV